MVMVLILTLCKSLVRCQRQVVLAQEEALVALEWLWLLLADLSCTSSPCRPLGERKRNRSPYLPIEKSQGCNLSRISTNRLLHGSGQHSPVGTLGSLVP